jgi:hypothetical protein
MCLLHRTCVQRLNEDVCDILSFIVILVWHLSVAERTQHFSQLDVFLSSVKGVGKMLLGWIC